MNKQRIILLIVLVGIVGAIWYLQSQNKSAQPATTNNNVSTDATIPVEATMPLVKAPKMSLDEKAKQYQRAKEIVNPSGFINTDRITIASLIGKKVILIDFWTYSCINCQRTTPYLNAWYDKYKDKGLEIVSIHSPEFEFEKDINNVRAAVKSENITFPVVLDNDFATWQAYGNRYWPRKYLIDIDGFITYDHIGEGGYDETEKKIQEALAERMERLQLAGNIEATVTTPPDAITPVNGSPETYFGSTRNELLANGTPLKEGSQTFVSPTLLQADKLYLTGSWDILPQYALNTTANNTILYNYTAKDVYFVAKAHTNLATLKITRDGKALTPQSAGRDVVTSATGSTVTINESRLYHLIHDTTEGSHSIQITVPGANSLEAYTFTFG